MGKFVSPISGAITEVNEDLEDECTLLNTDPYGKGWIMKIEPSDLDAELSVARKFSFSPVLMHTIP